MGFDTDLFVQQPVDEEYVCAICHSVLESPVSICKGGHTFCSECCEIWTRGQRKDSCPTCKRIVLEERPNLPVQNVIMRMMVKCPLTMENMEEEETGGEEEEGGVETRARKRARGGNGEAVQQPPQQACGWTGTLSDYLERHCVRECPFRIVQCSQCCDDIYACKLEIHEQSECEWRQVECQYCKETMIFSDLAMHQHWDCPDTETECSFCGEKMLRKLLGSKPDYPAVDDLPHEHQESGEVQEVLYTGHYQTCPKLPVKCDFHSHGCTALVKREDLASHHSNFGRRHAQLIADELIWSKKTIVWQVPKVAFIRAQQSPNTQLHVESNRVLVGGEFRAFAWLKVVEGKVWLGVGVEDSSVTPLIDRIKIKANRETLVDIPTKGKMSKVGSPKRMYVTGKEAYCRDISSRIVKRRSATIQDLLDRTRGNSCQLRASFRVKGPDAVKRGCKDNVKVWSLPEEESD